MKQNKNNLTDEKTERSNMRFRKEEKSWQWLAKYVYYANKELKLEHRSTEL
jgi:hypothetical protein